MHNLLCFRPKNQRRKSVASVSTQTEVQDFLSVTCDSIISSQITGSSSYKRNRVLLLDKNNISFKILSYIAADDYIEIIFNPYLICSNDTVLELIAAKRVDAGCARVKSLFVRLVGNPRNWNASSFL